MGANVRYIVNDVDRAIEFYTAQLGFEVQVHPSPGFAIVRRGDLTLLLNTPGGGGGAGEAMPDGAVPEPGGWNRFQLQVEDLEATVKGLTDMGASFRSQIVTGKGGTQILLEDPAGNLIELFEPFER